MAYENENGPMRISDRQQLEKLKACATSVTIAAGQKTSVQLALGK